MRAQEFIAEAQHSIRDQIIHAVDINGGSLDDYFVRFTTQDHLGFSDQQIFGHFPDVDDPDFDIDRITAQAKGRRVLWFYPLKTYLRSREGTYAMDFPYVWLVKLKPDAWLQTVRSGDHEVKPAPRGKQRVGILRMGLTPAALFFQHGFDVIGKYYDYAGQHQRHGQVKGVAEGLEQISIKARKGHNKFATELSVDGKTAGVYQYDANSGRSIAEVYPEYRGKGFGKILVLHAIYTAAKLGMDFVEDESRTAEYDNVLDSLDSNGLAVNDDGYWYVTGEGEQYLKQHLKQGVAEGSESLDYQGNCTEDDVVDDIFGDVNNFANMVEEYGDEFTRGDLVVKYDPKKDVHYFYYNNLTVDRGTLL